MVNKTIVQYSCVYYSIGGSVCTSASGFARGERVFTRGGVCLLYFTLLCRGRVPRGKLGELLTVFGRE